MKSKNGFGFVAVKTALLGMELGVLVAGGQKTAAMESTLMQATVRFFFFFYLKFVYLRRKLDRREDVVGAQVVGRT
eukprot:2790614-Heterocapsa_arctica.AAC.1